MSRQRALWVGDKIRSDSDICSLFKGVSEESRDEEKGKEDELGEVK